MALRMGWALRAGMLATLVACGDGGGGSGAGDADGGATSGDGASAGSGDTGGTNGSCDRMGRDVTEQGGKILSNLTIAGDTLVYLAGDPKLLMAPTVESVKVDGTSPAVLYTSTGRRRVRSVFAYGDSVFFYEDNEDVVAKHELFRLPLAGGEATRVGDVANEGGYIFGVDESHVYLVRNTAQPVGSVFERVEIATGALSVIGTITGTGTPGHVMLSGNDVFFHAGFAGPGASQPSNVYGFAKDADNATPSILWEAGPQDPCGFPLGGLVATPTKLGCGYGAVASHNRDGSEPLVLIERDALAPLNIVVASDAENLYLIETSSGQARDARMKRTKSTVGEVTNVVCDLGTVANQLVDGAFPIAYEWEVVVGEREVYWIERASGEDGELYQLRAGAK